eukprot:7762628-Pyramimonas_sp.AAC.1
MSSEGGGSTSGRATATSAGLLVATESLPPRRRAGLSTDAAGAAAGVSAPQGVGATGVSRRDLLAVSSTGALPT